MTKRGRPPHDDALTPAEWRVVDAIRHGLPNRLIAERQGVSLDAIKFHVANALAKLGLTRRAELRAFAGVARHSALYKQETKMTSDLTLGPLLQIARQVSDIKAAEVFYGELLGLPHLFTFGNLAFFDLGGVRLMLSAGDGEERASQSVLYFRVPDISAAYATLGARGVSFTHAPHMIHRHEDGVEEWMAFFPDPDGRPLAIAAQVRPS